jgi:hypothetical protein
LEQFEDGHHGVVIERDVVRIPALQRIYLRPATIRVLCDKNKIQSLLNPGWQSSRFVVSQTLARKIIFSVVQWLSNVAT